MQEQETTTHVKETETETEQVKRPAEESNTGSNKPTDAQSGQAREQQERLNKLIQARATLKASVDTGAEVAAKLTELVRELKKHRPE